MERSLEQAPSISGVKLVIGLFFAAVGVLLTLDNLDVIDADRYLLYWPLLLVVIGVMKLAESGGQVLGSLLVIAGGWMTAYNAHLVRFTIFDLWPLLLILAGLAIVGRAVGATSNLAVPSGWGILSSPKIVNTSQDFTGARLVGILGGCQLDLGGADITHGPAVIEAVAFWGGVEILVPEQWEVVGEVVPVMGSFEIKTRSATRADRKLIVRGLALMGGVEVKSAARRAS